MKKLMTTVAVLGCAVAMVSAQTVTSANMVGYAKKTLPAGGFQIVSPQFQGTAAGTTLDNAFSGVVDGSAVYIWTGTAYLPKISYFVGYGWFDAGFNPKGDTVINAGDALWLQDGGASSTPIISGEVPSASSITNTLAVGFNLIANPYPVAMLLDDIPLASLSDGDSVYVWSEGAYLPKISYFVGYGWFDAGFDPKGNTEIPVGDGLWLSSAAGGDLILNKLY